LVHYNYGCYTKSQSYNFKKIVAAALTAIDYMRCLKQENKKDYEK